jgi:hypothetical protein
MYKWCLVAIGVDKGVQYVQGTGGRFEINLEGFTLRAWWIVSASAML